MAHARDEQLVSVTLKASGHFKNADGSDIEVKDPRTARAEFDTNLNKALDADRKRAAMLRAVGAA